MPNNYEITFTLGKGDYNFENETSFIEWLFANKDKLENGNFTFKSELNNINVEIVENAIDFLKYYVKVKKSCDQGMEEYNNSLRKISNNEEIEKAFLEFVRLNENGKYLRAMLVALGYFSMGKKDEAYIDLALAIEVFQTAILIHDDIIDNADVRRGSATIPVAYKKYYHDANGAGFSEKRDKLAESIAICIGDFGFYLAEELIVKGYFNNENLSKMLSYYHQTAIKTCMGEILDITLPFKEEFYETDPNLEDKIMEVCRLKTAWYSVVGPYCLGLILGGASDAQIKKMEQILLNVGIAFQIKDDVLGIYGDDKKIGKSTNSDIEEYKQTILYSYTMNTEYKQDLLKYYGKQDLNNQEINSVKDIFVKSGAKEYAEDMMKKLFKQSILEIEKESWLSEETKSILKGFIVYLNNRSK